MKSSLITGLLFAAGFVLLAGVNFVVLSGVEENRKGIPEARLWLTERELPKINVSEKENSGLRLRLTWRALGREENDVNDRMPFWLKGKKLEELGFRFVDGASSGNLRDRESESREVFVALEYNGPAYRDAVKRAERALESEEEALQTNPADKGLLSARQQAKKRVQSEELTKSRLFAVDAGTDPRQLRAMYNDASRFIVTRGVVSLTYRNEGDRQWAAGYLESISPDKVHVPLEHRLVLEAIPPQQKLPPNERKQPRYEVELVYGSRYEPWITAIRPLEIQ